MLSEILDQDVDPRSRKGITTGGMTQELEIVLEALDRMTQHLCGGLVSFMLGAR
jgi:hypothetical protein